MIKGFKEFLFRGNVIDLAVAVVIGAAFGAVVTAIVEGLLTPLIAAVFGQPNFSRLSFTINNSVFEYGNVLNALFTFLAVATAIYFFVIVPVRTITEAAQRRRAAGEPADAAVPLSDEAVLLGEIRDLLRAQQR